MKGKCLTKSAEFCDDMKFYDEYISKLSLEEQAKFFEEFPEFMDDEGVALTDEQKDRLWQQICEVIK